MKPQHWATLAGVILCGALTYLIVPRNTAPRVSSGTVSVRQTNNISLSVASVPEVTTEAVPAEVPAAEQTVSALPKSDVPPQKMAPQKPRVSVPKKGKDPIKDPIAREALAWVGCSEEAEAYWVEAINDPSLSAQERQDLIEDLNEDGISDPKHPALEDLPVILNRLELIELLAPEAMDRVNAEAFLEAYRDLVNLAHVAVGAGEPVR